MRLALLLVVAAIGCSRFTVRSAHDPAADFSRLHTYAWMPLNEIDPADQRVQDRYMDKRLRAAVDTNLGAKGYRPADGAAPPDFFLNYRIKSESASAARSDRASYVSGWGGYWGGWVGWGGTAALYESYDQGTLFVAVLDGQTKRMVWLGAAGARLLPHLSLEKAAKRVDDAIRKILANFPPK